MKNIKAKILVTGGLGFISSHTTVELLTAGNSLCKCRDGEKKELGWNSYFSLKDMVTSAWSWQKNIHNF